MLLGLYRAQTELSVRSVGSVCRVSYTPSLSATVVAPQPDNTIPNTFSSKGSRVYLLTPRNDKNGITEFRDLKLLFDYIEDLKKFGLILSARAVNGQDVSGTVKAMETEELKLSSELKTLNSAYGAFIIESKNELQGTFLGFTE